METRIGVDYNDKSSCGELFIVEVSVLKGLKVIKNTLFTGVKDLREVIPHLIYICKENEGKIYFENNKKALSSCFAATEYWGMLENSPKHFNLFGKTKGITYTKTQQDLWNRYKNLFNYDEKFEQSARIAALGVLNDPLMFRNIQQLESYKKAIEWLKQEIK